MFRNSPDLDAVDVALLRILQEDCKTSLARLGEVVGLSAPAVMKRLRKLEQAGVIKGYRAELDSRAVGLDVTAFVGLSLNYPKDMDEFAQLLQNTPGIQECHHVTGKWSLLLKVIARNTADLEDLISKLRQVHTVQRTETLVVLSTRKERSAVPLAHPDLPIQSDAAELLDSPPITH